MSLLRAVVAGVVLVALLVGVPSLLILLVGNPLPEAVPTFDEIRVVLTQNGDGFGRALLAGLALLVWFLWIQVVIAFVVEVVALLRRRPAPHLPTIPGLQPLIGRLVAAATLSLSLAVGPVLVPAAGALRLDVPTAPVSTLSSFSSAGTQVAAQPLTPPDIVAAPPGPRLVVEERTELWDLAEAAYGDGLSWQSIASANAGGVDADGAPLTERTEVVPAGTTLVMPGAVDRGALGGFGIHLVEAGDSLWSIAEDHVERRGTPVTSGVVDAYWREVVAANDELPSGDADVIHPGDLVLLPPEPGVADPAPPDDHTESEGADSRPDAQVIDLRGVIDGPVEHGRAASTPSGSDVQGPAEGPAARSEQPSASGFDMRRRGITSPRSETPVDAGADFASDAERPLTPAVFATTGGALLAVGISGVLRRRRARQWRQRAPGRLPLQPSSDATALEILLAEVGDDAISSQLGNGWVLVDGDEVRRVLEVHDIEFVEPGASPPRMVATAVIGSEVGGDRPILFGLRPGMVVGLHGEQVDIARVARTLALDLAVSGRGEGDDVRVIAVGVAGELLDLERVEAVPTWAQACVAVHRLGAADELGPAVVVVGVTAADGDTLGLLRDLDAAVLAPVEADDHADEWIVVDGDRAVLRPTGIEVQLVALEDREWTLVADLIESTTLGADASKTSTAENPVADIEPRSGRPTAVEPGPVEVRVLGPVEIVGASPFSSVKAVDVVTYLAFHRHGVDADQLKTWVWPAFDPPTDKAFANVVSRARVGVGVDGAGAPYLSRAGSDRLYRLDEAVTTDFDRFQTLVAAADEASDPRQRLAAFQQALALVRGVPFTGGTVSSFGWADSQLRSHVEFTIDEAVHRCVDLAIDLDNHEAARAAVRVGLQVVPGCEQCFRRRFLIARADNNRQELRSAMVDLERTVASELGEPEGADLISHDLLMLFQELDRELVTRSA